MALTWQLTAANSQLVIIDVQERFVPVMPSLAADQPVARRCALLLQAAALLGVPRLISEQYPQGLGPTIPSLVAVAEGVPRLAKRHFSCVDDPALAQAFDDAGRRHVVLAGVEAHVCVLTTAADLIAHGYAVTVAGDAVASRDPAHVVMAQAALRDLGALVVPTETIVLRWQRCAVGDTFKALAALLR